jgi:hypothetical protein
MKVEHKNGIESWAETHHFIVAYITELLSLTSDHWPRILDNTLCNLGQGGVIDLCIDLTNKFEAKYTEDEENWFDKFEEFINTELK